MFNLYLLIKFEFYLKKVVGLIYRFSYYEDDREDRDDFQNHTDLKMGLRWVNVQNIVKDGCRNLVLNTEVRLYSYLLDDRTNRKKLDEGSQFCKFH